MCTQPIHPTASVVVFNAAGQVLLVDHEGYDQWVFPGGHSEDNDNNPAHTAVRELKEEAGVDVELVSDQAWMEETYASAPYPDEPPHDHRDRLFVGRCVGSEALTYQPEEVRGARWVSLDELSGMRCRNEVPVVAAKAWEYLNNR